MLAHITKYLDDNLLCLFYGIDLLATKYAIFACYHDLLSEIGDLFGVYTALAVLTLSAVLLLALIQETSTRILDVVFPTRKFFYAYVKLRLAILFLNSLASRK